MSDMNVNSDILNKLRKIEIKDEDSKKQDNLEEEQEEEQQQASDLQYAVDDREASFGALDMVASLAKTSLKGSAKSSGTAQTSTNYNEHGISVSATKNTTNATIRYSFSGSTLTITAENCTVNVNEITNKNIKIVIKGENVTFNSNVPVKEITNNAANSTINGSSGDDKITNNAENVTINAGAGNDTISNTKDNVTINGGAGNDTITNNGKNARIDAGADNDQIKNSGKNSEIYGGEGINITDKDVNLSLTDFIQILNGTNTSATEADKLFIKNNKSTIVTAVVNQLKENKSLTLQDLLTFENEINQLSDSDKKTWKTDITKLEDQMITNIKANLDLDKNNATTMDDLKKLWSDVKDLEDVKLFNGKQLLKDVLTPLQNNITSQISREKNTDYDFNNDGKVDLKDILSGDLNNDGITTALESEFVKNNKNNIITAAVNQLKENKSLTLQDLLSFENEINQLSDSDKATWKNDITKLENQMITNIKANLDLDKNNATTMDDLKKLWSDVKDLEDVKLFNGKQLLKDVLTPLQNNITSQISREKNTDYDFNNDGKVDLKDILSGDLNNDGITTALESEFVKNNKNNIITAAVNQLKENKSLTLQDLLAFENEINQLSDSDKKTWKTDITKLEDQMITNIKANLDLDKNNATTMDDLKKLWSDVKDLEDVKLFNGKQLLKDVLTPLQNNITSQISREKNTDYDFNNDGKVDLKDILSGDLNNDGITTALESEFVKNNKNNIITAAVNQLKENKSLTLQDLLTFENEINQLSGSDKTTWKNDITKLENQMITNIKANTDMNADGSATIDDLNKLWDITYNLEDTKLFNGNKLETIVNQIENNITTAVLKLDKSIKKADISNLKTQAFAYKSQGFNADGSGYNIEGYDKDGYNNRGFTPEGIHKDTGFHFDLNGLDEQGRLYDMDTDELVQGLVKFEDDDRTFLYVDGIRDEAVSNVYTDEKTGKTYLFSQGVLDKDKKIVNDNGTKLLFNNGELDKTKQIFDDNGVKLLFNNGELDKTTRVYDDGTTKLLFNNGELDKNTCVYDNGTTKLLFNNGELDKTKQEFSNQLFDNGELAVGTEKFGEFVFVSGEKTEGKVEFEGKTLMYLAGKPASAMIDGIIYYNGEEYTGEVTIRRESSCYTNSSINTGNKMLNATPHYNTTTTIVINGKEIAETIEFDTANYGSGDDCYIETLYYEGGKQAVGDTFDEQLNTMYRDGRKLTGQSTNGSWYSEGTLADNIDIDGIWYENGQQATGDDYNAAEETMYRNGEKLTGYTSFYNDNGREVRLDNPVWYKDGEIADKKTVTITNANGTTTDYYCEGGHPVNGYSKNTRLYYTNGHISNGPVKDAEGKETWYNQGKIADKKTVTITNADGTTTDYYCEGGHPVDGQASNGLYYTEGQINHGPVKDAEGKETWYNQGEIADEMIVTITNADGTTTDYYCEGGSPVTGFSTHKNAWYKGGSVADKVEITDEQTGETRYYEGGQLATGDDLVGETMYRDGLKFTGHTSDYDIDGVTQENATDTWYKDGIEANNVEITDEQTGETRYYESGQLATGDDYVADTQTMYRNGKKLDGLSSANSPDGKELYYVDGKLFTGFNEEENKFYHNGELLSGTVTEKNYLQTKRQNDWEWGNITDGAYNQKTFGCECGRIFTQIIITDDNGNEIVVKESSHEFSTNAHRLNPQDYASAVVTTSDIVMEDGEAKTGFNEDGSLHYTGGTPTTGFVEIEGESYFYENGIPSDKEGKVTIDGKSYVIQDGKAFTGFYTDDIHYTKGEPTCGLVGDKMYEQGTILTQGTSSVDGLYYEMGVKKTGLVGDDMYFEGKIADKVEVQDPVTREIRYYEQGKLASGTITEKETTADGLYDKTTVKTYTQGIRSCTESITYFTGNDTPIATTKTEYDEDGMVKSVVEKAYSPSSDNQTMVLDMENEIIYDDEGNITKKTETDYDVDGETILNQTIYANFKYATDENGNKIYDDEGNAIYLSCMKSVNGEVTVEKYTGLIGDIYYEEGHVGRGDTFDEETQTMYRDGNKLTGQSGGKYYVEGIAADGFVEVNGQNLLYEAGSLVSWEVDGILYNEGKPLTGTFFGEQYFDGTIANGTAQNGLHYTEGYPTNGDEAGTMYVDGKVANNIVIGGTLYENGVIATGIKMNCGQLFSNGVGVNDTIEGKLYVNGWLANGNIGGVQYVNGVETEIPAENKVQEAYQEDNGLWRIPCPQNMRYEDYETDDEIVVFSRSENNGIATLNWECYSKNSDNEGRIITQVLDAKTGELQGTTVENIVTNSNDEISSYNYFEFDPMQQLISRLTQDTNENGDVTYILDADGTGNNLQTKTVPAPTPATPTDSVEPATPATPATPVDSVVPLDSILPLDPLNPVIPVMNDKAKAEAAGNLYAKLSPMFALQTKYNLNDTAKEEAKLENVLFSGGLDNLELMEQYGILNCLEDRLENASNFANKTKTSTEKILDIVLNDKGLPTEILFDNKDFPNPVLITYNENNQIASLKYDNMSDGTLVTIEYIFDKYNADGSLAHFDLNININGNNPFEKHYDINVENNIMTDIEFEYISADEHITSKYDEDLNILKYEDNNFKNKTTITVDPIKQTRIRIKTDDKGNIIEKSVYKINPNLLQTQSTVDSKMNPVDRFIVDAPSKVTTGVNRVELEHTKTEQIDNDTTKTTTTVRNDDGTYNQKVVTTYKDHEVTEIYTNIPWYIPADKDDKGNFKYVRIACSTLAADNLTYSKKEYFDTHKIEEEFIDEKGQTHYVEKYDDLVTHYSIDDVLQYELILSDEVISDNALKNLYDNDLTLQDILPITDYAEYKLDGNTYECYQHFYNDIDGSKSITVRTDIEKVNNAPRGDGKRKAEYIIDQDGKVLQYKEFENGEWVSTYDAEYDENGKLVWEANHDNNGNSESVRYHAGTTYIEEYSKSFEYGEKIIKYEENSDGTPSSYTVSVPNEEYEKYVQANGYYLTDPDAPPAMITVESISLDGDDYFTKYSTHEEFTSEYYSRGDETWSFDALGNVIGYDNSNAYIHIQKRNGQWMKQNSVGAFVIPADAPPPELPKITTPTVSVNPSIGKPEFDEIDMLGASKVKLPKIPNTTTYSDKGINVGTSTTDCKVNKNSKEINLITDLTNLAQLKRAREVGDITQGLSDGGVEVETYPVTYLDGKQELLYADPATWTPKQRLAKAKEILEELIARGELMPPKDGKIDQNGNITGSPCSYKAANSSTTMIWYIAMPDGTVQLIEGKEIKDKDGKLIKTEAVKNPDGSYKKATNVPSAVVSNLLSNYCNIDTNSNTLDGKKGSFSQGMGDCGFLSTINGFSSAELNDMIRPKPSENPDAKEYTVTFNGILNTFGNHIITPETTKYQNLVKDGKFTITVTKEELDDLYYHHTLPNGMDGVSMPSKLVSGDKDMKLVEIATLKLWQDLQYEWLDEHKSEFVPKKYFKPQKDNNGNEIKINGETQYDEIQINTIEEFLKEIGTTELYTYPKKIRVRNTWIVDNGMGDLSSEVYNLLHSNQKTPVNLFSQTQDQNEILKLKQSKVVKQMRITGGLIGSIVGIPGALIYKKQLTDAKNKNPNIISVFSPEDFQLVDADINKISIEKSVEGLKKMLPSLIGRKCGTINAESTKSYISELKLTQTEQGRTDGSGHANYMIVKANGSNDYQHLANSHAYKIVGYDDKNENILIVNPWRSDTILNIPYETFVTTFTVESPEWDKYFQKLMDDLTPGYSYSDMIKMMFG